MDFDEDFNFSNDITISDFICISILLVISIFFFTIYFKKERKNKGHSYKNNNNSSRNNKHQNFGFINNKRVMNNLNNFNSINPINNTNCYFENKYPNNNFLNINNNSSFNNINSFRNNYNNTNINYKNNFNTISNNNKKNNIDDENYLGERFKSKIPYGKNKNETMINQNLFFEMNYIHSDNNNQYNNNIYNKNIGNTKKFGNNIKNFYNNINNSNCNNKVNNFDNNINNDNYKVNNFINNINNGNYNNFGNNFDSFDNNIDSIDINFDNSIGFIVKNIHKEPKIGLNNIGATCYMNATLQCFSHTIKLSNYFLSPYHQNLINSNENKLSKSYLEVLKNLWIKNYNNNKDNYSPYDFKNIISQMDSSFKGVTANDSKDLINFILQQLHLELNKIKYNNNIYNINNFNLNQNDEMNVLQYFLEDYKKNNQSIISDLFYGIIETKTECLQCKKRNQCNGIYNPIYLYNFQIINFIIFPLEEIRKTKSEIFNFYFNEVTIYDCFDFYQKEELMQGQNQMWCKYCKQNTVSEYCTLIYSSPEYFILILNRGKGNIYDVKLQFEEIIDISNYVKMKINPILKYQLYAIVSHIGPSSMAGHFIAFCKSPIDCMWYKYNDSEVDLIGSSFSNIQEGCPYILFYERQGL